MERCQLVFALAVIIGVLHCGSGDLFDYFRGSKLQKKADISNEVVPDTETTTEYFEGIIAHNTDIPYIRPLPQPDNTISQLSSVAEHKINDSAREGKQDQKLRDPMSTVFEARSDTTSPDLPEYSSPEDGPTTYYPTYPSYAAGPRPYNPTYPSPYIPPGYGHHPPYRPQVPEVKNFLCTFEQHACGFRNDVNTQDQFRLVSNSVASRGGRYMAVDAMRLGRSMSRLITPYLPGYRGATACIGFNFIIAGPGAERIELLTQTNHTRRVLALERDAYRWDDFQYHIEVPQDVRFFIEAYTTDKGQGVIAIDNFSYYFGKCGRRAWS